MIKDHFCKCPYILCQIHGKCRACIAKNRKEDTLAFCMEAIAEKKGAELKVNLPDSEIYETERGMARRCAQIVKETLSAKPDALLCFPAGMSVVSTCEELRKMQEAKEINFSKAQFVSLDEWLDLEDESENCTHFLHKHLYDPLGIKENQLHLFNPHAEDLEAECRRIDRFIFDSGHIDLMLLGMGMNGHLGLNEPGGNFSDYAKVVPLSETTISVGQKYFSQKTKLTRGITLGIHHVFESKRVVLQVCGAHKQKIMYKLYHTRPTEELPASALMLMNRACVIADRAAAGRILDLVEVRPDL